MKTSGIGGQAVMEGVMMKNGDKYAVAVRKEDHSVIVDVQEHKNWGEKSFFFRLPIIRGVVTFIESLVLGVKTLTWSAGIYEDDDASATASSEKDEALKAALLTPEEQKAAEKARRKRERGDNLLMALTVCLSIALAVSLFMVLPYYLSRLLKVYINSDSWLALCEGVIRVVLFVGYVAAISLMKDIKRVYMYHGAEHKSINCVEHGLELTVENVRAQSRQHKRCGTSFMLVVMLISVLLFMLIRVDNAWMRLGLRLVLVPVIAGISYEFIRLAGRTENPIVSILSKPGLWLQKLTTSEPDDEMIEVAIASVEAVFDWKDFLAHYNEKPLKGKAAKEAAKAKKAAEAGKSPNQGNGQEHKNKKNRSGKRGNDDLGYFRANRKSDSSPLKAAEQKQDDASHEPRKPLSEDEEARGKGSVDDVTKRTARLRIIPAEERLDLHRPAVQDDEDDEILKALDQFFVRKKRGNESEVPGASKED